MSGDSYPLGADCDVDALVAWRHRQLDDAINMARDYCLDLTRAICPWLPDHRMLDRAVDDILRPLHTTP